MSVVDEWNVSVIWRSDTDRWKSKYVKPKQAMYSTYNVILRRVRVTSVAVEKRWVTYSECVFQASRYPACKVHTPCCIVVCGLSSRTSCSHIMSITTRFPEKVSEHTVCVFIFSTSLSKIFLILRRIEWDIINNVYCASCKEPVIIVRFCWYLNFHDRISKSAQIPNFVKIRAVRAEFHADGRTDRQTWN